MNARIAGMTTAMSGNRGAVVYARVSSKDQEREGFSILAQQKLLRAYAHERGLAIRREFVDVETAKQARRSGFGEMLACLKADPSCRTILVEKTDRLYRNIRDWITVDELDLEVHFVKEGAVVSKASRSSEKFMHGIKVLMAKNYVDNLSEEVRKGLREKAAQGHWPGVAHVGYVNNRITRRIDVDPARGALVMGLLTCGRCGCAMTAETKKGKYVYYRCTGFKGACGNAYVREERLSALLGAVIAPIQITAEIADDIAMALRASDTDAEQRRGARWETELRTIDVERTGLETGAFEPHVRARNSRDYLDFAVRFVGQRERNRNGGEGGIRTHVPVTRQDAFEAPPLRPLRYLSVEENASEADRKL